MHRTETEIELPMERRVGVLVCAGDGCAQSGGLEGSPPTRKHGTRHSCEDCGKVFPRASALKIHVQKDHNGRRWACDECGKEFMHNTSLRKHVRAVHRGEARCDVCGVCFGGGMPSLARHKRIHTGTRPFTCPSEGCDRVFRSASDMRRHHRCRHVWPRCVICGEYGVRNYDATTRGGQMCGHCQLTSGITVHGDKERVVFSHLRTAAGLEKHTWTLRDVQVGCGSRRRPDGAIRIPDAIGTSVDGPCGPILFMLEVDEYMHKRHLLACEAARLGEIADASHCALYVLRYNPDAPNALLPEQLTTLANRVLQILSDPEELQRAVQAFDLIHVEYMGYTPHRARSLETTRALGGTSAITTPVAALVPSK